MERQAVFMKWYQLAERRRDLKLPRSIVAGQLLFSEDGKLLGATSELLISHGAWEERRRGRKPTFINTNSVTIDDTNSVSTASVLEAQGSLAPIFGASLFLSRG